MIRTVIAVILILVYLIGTMFGMDPYLANMCGLIGLAFAGWAASSAEAKKKGLKGFHTR